MVRKGWWDREIERAIKITKMRIKHHEKHGCGFNVIADKRHLVTQERTKQKRDAR